MRRKARTRWFWSAAVIAMALLVAACGSDDGDDAAATEEAADTAQASGAEVVPSTVPSGENEDGAAEEVAAVEADEAATEPAVPGEDGDAVAQDDSADEEGADEEGADGEDALGAGGAAVTPTAADLGRKLIFTAFLNVGVDDVAAASAEATSIIEGLGGFLFGQNTTGGNEPTSELTFKVLPDDFNRALDALGTVGELRNQTVTTDDVTERIVDLESRIEVADLGVARLRTALEGAATLEDYAEIERLLLDRESELEVMRGQLRTLQDRVDLATITLFLTQERLENTIDLQITGYGDHDGGDSCPGRDRISVEVGQPATVCFEVINSGDQTLTDIALTDTVLEIDGETDLLPVFGSLDSLAPGQSALVAHEIDPERDVRLRTRVTAIPTDGTNADPVGPTVSTDNEFAVDTFEPERNPGFGDGFDVGLGLLRGLWVAITVMLGFLIPLLIILVPLAVAARWLWRRFGSSLRRARPAPPSQPSSPPGPPATPSPPPPAPPSAPTPPPAPVGSDKG